MLLLCKFESEHRMFVAAEQSSFKKQQNSTFQNVEQVYADFMNIFNMFKGFITHFRVYFWEAVTPVLWQIQILHNCLYWI